MLTTPVLSVHVFADHAVETIEEYLTEKDTTISNLHLYASPQFHSLAFAQLQLFPMLTTARSQAMVAMATGSTSGALKDVPQKKALKAKYTPTTIGR